MQGSAVSNKMSPGELAALVPGVGAVGGIESIKHGLTNESWRVQTDAGELVVRVSSSLDASLQINRASEALILAAVARAGIGPEVLLCDPARQVLITRYMGPTWTDADALRDENIARVGTTLRQLHELTPPPGLHRVDLKAVVEGYLDTLSPHALPPDAGSAAMRARACEVAEVLQAHSPPRLCHNDVHALNVVDGAQGLRLIDWEYAGLGAPLFDLAALCVYHDYDPVRRARLLSAYDPLAGGMDAHRLELACWLFAYVRDLWTAVRSMTGR